MLSYIRASAKLVSSIVPKFGINTYQNVNIVPGIIFNKLQSADLKYNVGHNYGTLSTVNSSLSPKPLLSVVSPFTPQPSRNIIKFSLKKGKRKSCKEVIRRFYRLDWGVWIRTKCGRAKKMYKKSASRKRRLRQHVFTNATQSYLLDKMVTNYWRRPRLYVDDPYEPYHNREEFPFTRRKPYVPPS